MVRFVYLILALVISAAPVTAATVAFDTTGAVTESFALPGAAWTGNHPSKGETYTRILSVDDTADPVSFRHIATDRFDTATATFAARETWHFASSGISTSRNASLAITVDNMSGKVALGYNGVHYSSFPSKTANRPYQSDATITELIFLLAQGPVFRNGHILNHGEPHHWIGGCVKTVYRAWCSISFDVASSGLSDPGYIPAVPQSFTDQRALLTPVPVPAALPMLLSVLSFLALIRTRRH